MPGRASEEIGLGLITLEDFSLIGQIQCCVDQGLGASFSLTVLGHPGPRTAISVASSNTFNSFIFSLLLLEIE